MKVSLVTGGAGFIGSHLVEAQLAAGHRVIVMDDLSTGSLGNLERIRDNPNFCLVNETIANESLLCRLLDEADEVYHLAAVVGVRYLLDQLERTVATNIGPVQTILRQLAVRPKPLFLASTSEIYGKNPKSPQSEEDEIVFGSTMRSRWIYGCSKAIDEFLALAQHQRNGLPVVIGRFFNVAGPRQVGHYGMVLPRFVDQALAGGPLLVYGDGRQVRCFGHVTDVVDAVLKLMVCPAAYGRVFNIGNDVPVSIRELAETVVHLVDPRAAIEHVPYEQAFPPGFEDIRCRVPDLTRVRQAIGYRPRFTLEDIVRDVVAWKSDCAVVGRP
jgi:UDP-glucose 4-epimerase